MTEFKQRLLNHNWQNHNYPFRLPMARIVHETNSWKPFLYHDGTYIMVPDVADYAMWDGDMGNELRDADSNRFTKILMHANLSQVCSVSYLSEQWKKKDVDKIYFQSSHGISSTVISFISYHGDSLRFCLLSNDGKWLVADFGTSIEFVDIQKSQLGTRYNFPLESITFCAAYHSPLFAVYSPGSLVLVTPTEHVAETRVNFAISPNNRSIQFSPDDAYLCLHDGNDIMLCDVRKALIERRNRKLPDSIRIRKVFFSPDSTKLLVALKNGRLICGSGFFKDKRQIGDLYFGDYSSYATWRCEDVADIDNQAPCILWGDNDLLFSLDPADHTDETIFTFVVYRASTGRFLTAYKFFPHNPIAMGLTKDQGAVIFVHKDHKVSQVNLYNDGDNDDIDFIESKTSLYELCCLWQICKDKAIAVDQIDSQKDRNAQQFVIRMRLMIGKFEKSEEGAFYI